MFKKIRITSTLEHQIISFTTSDKSRQIFKGYNVRPWRKMPSWFQEQTTVTRNKEKVRVRRVKWANWGTVIAGGKEAIKERKKRMILKEWFSDRKRQKWVSTK